LGVALAYHVLLIAGPINATLGMRLFGIRVHSVLGGPPSLVQAALHAVCFYGSLGLGGGILLIFPFFNTRRRALHDVLAGTVVLRDP